MTASQYIPEKSQRSVTWFLASLGVLLAFGIDVALPAFGDIGDDLDGVDGRISLVGTTYLLGLAFGQLIFGPVSDRFGRRPALVVGLGLYALGALGSALAPSFEWLLIARAVWGLGGAAPAALRFAIARDLYNGDDMARLITIVMAVFLIGPVIVPFVGEGILQLGSWRFVFVAAVGIALVMSTWTISFGETLAEGNRRSLSARPLIDAFRHIASTRQTVTHSLALTLYSGAFFVYLGSGQPIIDRIYGRGDQFVWWFGLGGVAMMAALLFADRLIARFGAAAMMTSVSILMTVASLGGLGLAFVDGRSMTFPVWIVWIVIINCLQTVATPLTNSLALEPMGELAGTASAAIGCLSMAGGALAASVVDSLIDTTVFPMLVANVIATVGGLALVRFGRPRPA